MISGVIKVDPVYEDEYVTIIKDINPQAPIHLLILPKQVPIGKLVESTGKKSFKF
jgi:diadenosine tetraphosphate (Ap4A) HIT family hydrolase